MDTGKCFNLLGRDLESCIFDYVEFYKQNKYFGEL